MQISKKTAIVSFIKDGEAFLKTDDSSSCSKCSARSSCSSFNFFEKSSTYLRIKNTKNLDVGDSVNIGLTTDRLLLGTVIMYFLPLLALFLFAAVGKSYGGELYSILAGLSGFSISLLFIKRYMSKNKVIKQFTPKILDKVVNEE